MKKKQRRKKNNVAQNKKIKNATPVECDNIQFKSRLEKYCYKKLTENNIYAIYEGETFTILEAFEYNGEKVRKMTYTPDFVSNDFIIECKGYGNDAFPLRWKVFKYYLKTTNQNYTLYLVKNKGQIDQMIKHITNEM